MLAGYLYDFASSIALNDRTAVIT
ncbi:hypothetical protein RSK60_470004 [Ralstonia solanacearum K60]|nr:hypothetical protein RSK60_470004 [Ralstonia solanacearum K60]